MKKIIFLLFIGTIVFACASIAAPGVRQTSVVDSYERLVNLFRDFREMQKPKFVNHVPDYTEQGMKERHGELMNYLSKLKAIDITGWSVAQKIDYIIVRAEMNGLDFDHRIIRPWSRDPGFYVVTPIDFGPRMQGSLRIPKQLPLVELDEFQAKLKAIPKILEQARHNLTEPSADLTMLAIRAKKKESTAFSELASKFAKYHPELVKDANNARKACDTFRHWLEENISRWTASSGLGQDNYDWYLKNVHVFPYTWDQIFIIAERELDRTVAFLKMEEHQNRATPMIERMIDKDEFHRSFEEAELELLDFLRNEEIMNIPDYLTPSPLEPFDRRPGQQHFFQQAGDRDPRPLRAHNLPGHRFDSLRAYRDERTIRGPRKLYFIQGVRADGFATYLEEMTMQAGWFDQLPKTREITYILLAKRAARIASELKMHSNEWTFQEAFSHLVRETPYWMGDDDEVAWFDLELYLRQPAYGMGYTLGKLQIEGLITDMHRIKGLDFDLGAFHNEFLASGMIPVSLTRWEMTGLDDEVRHMLEW